MFKTITSLFGKNQNVPTNALDPTFGLAEVSTAAECLKLKRYDDFRKLYYRLPADKRSSLIEGIAMTEKYGNLLENWVKSNSDCPVANVMSGSYWTFNAWEARTGQRAKEVTEEQFQLFFEYLDKAYEYLRSSLELNSEDPEPFARMLRVLMGLNEPLEVLHTYFDAMVKLQPDHLYGHLYLLNASTEKWLGSDEEMMAFVNKVISNTPKGSLLYTLVPFAHFELWAKNKKVNHFTQDTVKAEVSSAYQKSVLSGELQESHLTPLIHNYFCFALYLMGQESKAREERRKFGEHMSYMPWAYYGVETPAQVDKLIKKTLWELI